MSFNFNFDDDDDLPFDMKEFAKIFKTLQAQIMEQLRQQGIDPTQLDLSDLQRMMGGMNPDDKVSRFGFSISMGPDGKPNIKPLDGKDIPFEMPSKQPSQNNGFEEPFVDVFFSEETGKYQIIAEITGVEDKDLVHIRTEERNLRIHAESGPAKYRTSLELEHIIDPDTIEYTVTNGVLELIASTH